MGLPLDFLLPPFNELRCVDVSEAFVDILDSCKHTNYIVRTPQRRLLPSLTLSDSTSLSFVLITFDIFFQLF